MPRHIRIIVKNIPHHITQRGNYKQKIFFSDKDRTLYLKWLKEYSEKYKLTIWAYCLMNNHVHLVAVPKNENSMAKTFNALNMKYAQYINKKKEITGHLWHGRFFSCPMDDRHAYIAIKYIEQNPVRAQLVEKPWDWKWSSASCHIGAKDIFNLLEPIPFMPPPDDWQEELLSIDIKPITDKLIKTTHTGLPFADLPFIKKLEAETGLKLCIRRVGRPMKIE